MSHIVPQGGDGGPLDRIAHDTWERRPFRLYLFVHTKRDEPPEYCLTVLSPAEAHRAGGLHPQAVAGKLLDVHGGLVPSNFVAHGLFVDLLHATHKRVIPANAGFAAEARRMGYGWLHLHDGRANYSNPEVAKDDLIGAFVIRDGAIVRDSYVECRSHALVSEYGMCIPHPLISEAILDTLRSLSPGAPLIR